MSDPIPTVTQAIVSPSPETVALRLARALGAQYEVGRLIGRGGFAEVYEVMDIQLDRKLAVKVLRPDLLWSAGTLTRFRDEARAIARLDHPNILSIYFVGEGQGLVYYAMPLVDGTPLSEVLRRDGPMPVPQAVTVIAGVLAALAHAHAAGLIHRDIKPDNILIENGTGRVLLVDFGIAKRIGAGDAGTTQAGFVVGTPTYMSPEQALGQPDVDRRADLYAVGAVLVQMVAGSPPYEGADSQEVAGKHVHAPVPVLAARTRGVPDWLSDLVTRALAKDRSARFQDALEMLEAIRAGGEQADVKPVRKRIPTATVVLAIVLGGVILAALLGGIASRKTTVTVMNRLPVAVGVVSGSVPEIRIGAGDSAQLEVPRAESVPLSWYAIPVKGPRNQPLGEELQRTLVLDSRARGLVVEARADGGSQPMFQPYITNNTNQPLSFRINVGSASERDCNCTVPPGAKRIPIGFYPLYRNSSVRAVSPDGRIATFPRLGSEVDRATGVVRLTFNARDLRDSTALVARIR